MKLYSLDVLGIEENHSLKDIEILDRLKKNNRNKVMRAGMKQV